MSYHNNAYQLSIAAENIVGDETSFIEIKPMANDRLFIGLCHKGRIDPELALANITARGFVVEDSASHLDGQAFTAQCLPTDKVPDISKVLGG